MHTLEGTVELQTVSETDRAAEREVRRERSHEEVARRAYELFEARGGAEGGELDDWLEAERQLKLAGD